MDNSVSDYASLQEYLLRNSGRLWNADWAGHHASFGGRKQYALRVAKSVGEDIANGDLWVAIDSINWALGW